MITNEIRLVMLNNLTPSSQNNPKYKRGIRDANGTRVYQVILNSMQVLPVTDIFQITNTAAPTTTTPQKRKPADNLKTSVKARKKKNSSFGKRPTTKSMARSMTDTITAQASGSKTSDAMDTL